MTYVSLIQFFGKPAALACDSRCDKAWGICGRPAVAVGETEDDFAYKADDELGAAPADPGTSEGGDLKPRDPSEIHNNWCARECERSVLTGTGLGPNARGTRPAPDFSRRVYNIPRPADTRSDSDAR